MNSFDRLEVPGEVKPWLFVHEYVWGHRFGKDQSVELIILEFLNIFIARDKLQEDLLNDLKYQRIYQRPLQVLLFRLSWARYVEIRDGDTDEDMRWYSWEKALRQVNGVQELDCSLENIAAQIRRSFYSFSDFVELVSMVRECSLQAEEHKRWGSQFLFPFGPACLYNDLKERGTPANDRRFFARGGELLYQMLARSKGCSKLSKLLHDRFSSSDNRWNRIVKVLQGEDFSETKDSGEASWLPYEADDSFESLAEDWISILELDLSWSDCVPHLIRATGLNLHHYFLRRALIEGNHEPSPVFVCEVIGPKVSTVRRAAVQSYQKNRVLIQEAPVYRINRALRDEEYVKRLQRGRDEECKTYLKDEFRVKEDVFKEIDHPVLEVFVENLTNKAREHQKSLPSFHSFPKEIGLGSKRSTNRYRYAPLDEFFRSLVLMMVKHRVEFKEFLQQIYDRYGLVFGPAEAERWFASSNGNAEFDRNGFQMNLNALESRLKALGLLNRLSDACAFIINPYRKEE